MHFYMHAKVTEFANLLHYEFVGTTTRDPASLSNRLYPAEAGKKWLISICCSKAQSLICFNSKTGEQGQKSSKGGAVIRPEGYLRFVYQGVATGYPSSRFF